MPFTASSSWTWIGHPVSGLHTLTSRPIKTWFPCGSGIYSLNLASKHNSPDRSTKSTPLSIYSSSTACKHRVSGSLSLPSRGPFHLSLTVLITIGHWSVFSLGGWSPRFHTEFLVFRTTPDPARLLQPSDTGLSPSPAGFPNTVLLIFAVLSAVHYPDGQAHRFRLLRFRSPLLTESMFLSFPPGT